MQQFLPTATMDGGWTIQTLVRELAGRGDRPCVVAFEAGNVKRMSCAEFARIVTALARGLLQCGVEPGETIGLIAPNGPDWAIARLALGCTGALVHALDDLYSDAELRIALEEARCTTIFTSPAHVERLRAIDPAVELVVLGDDAVVGTTSWRDLVRPGEGELPPVDPQAPAMLVYTSGTTGRPKAFVLTSTQLWANVSALRDSGLIGPDDRVLLPLPLQHVYPFLVGILMVLTCGSTIVFPEEVAGPQILRALAEGKVTAMIGVPRLYTALVTGLQAKIAKMGALGAVFRGLIAVSIWSRKHLGINAGHVLLAPIRKRLGPGLRLLASGGARLQPEVLWPLVGLGFDVRTGYGLAETASIFTGNLPGHSRFESEGQAFCGEIRIAKEEGAEEGEIQLRGPTVFSGYRNNEEANRQSFTPDGWFRTGDVGHLDQDGFLFVTGRSKEMIVLGGGKKVLPEDLEKHYIASPYIKEIGVLEKGGALVALVLPDLEAIRASGSPRVEEVIRVALTETALALPTYERLAGYRLVRAPLPKTRLGKYRRFRLPALYDAAETKTPVKTDAPLTAEDKALVEREPARTVLAILKKRYAGKPVTLDASPLLDLGIDSLEWVALALVLEQKAGVHIDEAAAGESLTVRDLLTLASEAPPARRGTDAATFIAQWLTPAGPFARALAALINAANAVLMRLLFRARAEGLENLPAQGPFVLVVNHESDIDVGLVAAALWPARLKMFYWAGDAVRLFKRRWMHPLWRALHVFPANERRASETLTVGQEVLRRGDCLIWFPESWRSPDGKLQRFLPGIGRVLMESRVPVVPAFIEGAFEAMPRNKRLPRLLPVTITFGPPVTFAPDGNTPQSIADALHDAVAALDRSQK